MNKIISFLSALAIVILLSACASNKSNAPEQTDFSKTIISKVEQGITLTDEQKNKIAELVATSGLSKEVERSEESKAKYKTLMKQVKSEVLTPEQRAEMQKNKKAQKSKKPKKSGE